MTAKKIDYLREARERGLTLVGHELRLVPHKTPRFGSKVPAKTLDGIAACAALGLTYWSEHPDRNTVWAADFNGQYHAVHIDKLYNKVRCLTDDRTAPWDGQVPDTPAALFTALNGEFTVEQPAAPKTKIPFDLPRPAQPSKAATRAPRAPRRSVSEMDDLMSQINAELDSREVS